MPSCMTRLARPQSLADPTKTLAAHQPSLHNITVLHESKLGGEALSITDCPREGRGIGSSCLFSKHATGKQDKVLRGV